MEAAGLRSHLCIAPVLLGTIEMASNLDRPVWQACPLMPNEGLPTETKVDRAHAPAVTLESRDPIVPMAFVLELQIRTANAKSGAGKKQPHPTQYRRTPSFGDVDPVEAYERRLTGCGVKSCRCHQESLALFVGLRSYCDARRSSARRMQLLRSRTTVDHVSASSPPEGA